MLRPAQPARTFTAWSPRVRIEYRPANRVLLYASATRGFKSGGFNLMNTGEVFAPETLWSVEGGAKATWREGTLRTNAAVFYYDYRDLQVNQFSGVTNLVTNAASSRIGGLELQVVAKPSAWLQADFAAALLEATYRRYLMMNANDPQATLDLSGNRMPHAPRATLNFGLEGRIATSVRGALSLRGEGRYQSRTYFDQLDTPQLSQGGHAVFGARAAFMAASERWSIALFGENLANKAYRQSVIRVDNVLGTVATYGMPRTYGVQVGTQF
jgi:iron complex outermembrane receptor protein